MTIDEALNTLEKAVASYHGTLADHQTLQTAIQIVRKAVTKPKAKEPADQKPPQP